ncbi:2,5-diketo-D-gluconic acid reductase [Granulibacter bethesdensis CGDNIH1]|uniref:2,5-diketo-D-gluconic acid reductase n=2 Tax=Granulibacter bethesdensis TaxID=364410 RepID=Q0BU18_GRABC|nr:2,5-diketo-D-gluconic acid reductase [Granulibacter bethesdensis CGDNIH1]APH51490.1 2,5-diketo-D-gluconic acid reductase [Granulibacter bethesdensis]APH64183.1 2,5-diketo-D-gluconic acid reductase [Granulibacter bethesdensis]
MLCHRPSRRQRYGSLAGKTIIALTKTCQKGDLRMASIAVSQVPLLSLNDGHAIPQIGLGVYKIIDHQVEPAIHTAIEAGYRLIDTASFYGNEEQTGAAIAASSVPRSELFITTKLWNDDQGYDQTLHAFDLSMERLGLEYLDLYLIHWPVPARDRYVDTWRALIRLQKESRVRSIGVSNFQPAHLRRLIDETGVIPCLNQVELHPALSQPALRAFHASLGIVTQAWSPLARGSILHDERLVTIAARHQRSPAQIVLRWHLQNGSAVIPKSATPARIKDNIALFDFNLDATDMRMIDALRTDCRTGADPDTAH